MLSPLLFVYYSSPLCFTGVCEIDIVPIARSQDVEPTIVASHEMMPAQ